MQRIFFLKNFYTESLTLFYCVPFRIFFLEPTKLSLTCPASIYVIASTRHDGNRGAGGKCNFNFRISWKFNLKQIVKQTFKTWNQFRLLSGVITMFGSHFSLKNCVLHTMTKKERVSQIRTKISVLNKNCYFKLNEKIIRGWGGGEDHPTQGK